MTPQEKQYWLASLIIVHCCRDWPLSPYMGWGRCGICGEHPTRIEKTVDQYMAERKARAA